MKDRLNNVEWVFRASVYTLVCYSSVILAISQSEFFPSLVTLVAAPLAWHVVDRGRLWSLSPFWINALSLLALLAAAVEFRSEVMVDRLVAGAHFLVYLTWIVFFMEKERRQFWWLCALGVLQVAVGAVLTDRVHFGLLVLGYLFVGIWTLSLFSLYESQKLIRGAGRLELAAAPTVALTPRGPGGRSTVPSDASSWLQQLVQLESRAWGGIQVEPGQSFLAGRFLWGSVVMGLLSLLVAAFFFALIPRIWISSFSLSDDSDAGTPLTGFTSEVRLGDIGEILESTEPVLEVKLYDEATGEKLDVDEYARSLGYDEPLFRGVVLDDYRNGKWVATEAEQVAMSLAPRPPRGRDFVRQEITLAPIGTRTLFAIFPVVAASVRQSNAPVGVTLVGSCLRFGAAQAPRRQIRYVVYSERQLRDDRLIYEVRGFQASLLRRRHFFRYLQLPRGLERLAQLARTVAADELRRPNAQLAVAKKLEAYLRDSGEFAYSLDLSVTDPTIDPVEDFLFNRKRGHCEYFASSLALMLRAVGIPSRLVSGFKGGSVNTLTGAYVVEQRHAHAWVEAYIDGKWVTLDPTPYVRALSVQSLDPALPTWKDFVQFVRYFWSNQMMGLSLQDQYRKIYGPLRDTALALWRHFEELLHNGPGLEGQRPNVWRQLLKWGVLGLGALVVLSVVDWLLRRYLKINSWFPNVLLLLARWLKRLPAEVGLTPRPTVEFYERFQRLLESFDIQRRPSDTPREFAVQAQQRLHDRLAQVSVAEDFPSRLVECFYAVRFGARRLSREELRWLESELDRLEAALRRRNGA